MNLEKSYWEQEFMQQLHLAGLPAPTREYMPIKGRRFRTDFAWMGFPIKTQAGDQVNYIYVGRKVAVEIEGGIWIHGRHTNPVGYTNDCRKYNLMALEGWIVLRFTPAMVESGEALEITEKALK